MTTIVTRLYATKATAEAVVKALAEAGFLERDVDMIAPPGAKPTAADMKKVNAALKAAEVFPGAAEAYSAHIKDGKSLVVVRPPFGGTMAAQRVVDAHGPIESGVKHQDAYVHPRNTAPIIESRQLPALLPNDARFLTGGIFPGLANGQIFGGIPAVMKNTGRAGLVTGAKFTAWMPLLFNRRITG